MLGMRRGERDEDELRETPTAVVWAVAAGTAPLPFLAVYAVLFIVHGGFHHVAPPDITSTQRGELVAGLIALAVFIVAVIALLWMLSGRRRWPFVLVQLGILATAIDFVIDPTKGGRMISSIVAVAALAALCCGFLPQSWEHFGHRTPALRRAAAAPNARESAATLEEDTTSKDHQAV